MDNVFITPHCSNRTEDYFERAVEKFSTNVKKFINKEELINRVNPEKGY